MSEFLNAQSGQTPDPPSSAPGSTDEKVAKLSRDMLNFDARLSTLIDLLNSSPIFNPPPLIPMHPIDNKDPALTICPLTPIRPVTRAINQDFLSLNRTHLSISSQDKNLIT
ncbi:hypothetical protein PCASD_19142 [Puccinia coronata f. sp. avenae]|uniref:Uncharacterized protein n=1 Tax=Puccinia coronata f. sp. avenae TaxID=200324 RepID=A0A2N5TQ70_9BASI|nr:hypothetical protein PCASD_19142 [Puccinia coronata f. sp. avenae]